MSGVMNFSTAATGSLRMDAWTQILHRSRLPTARRHLCHGRILFPFGSDAHIDEVFRRLGVQLERFLVAEEAVHVANQIEPLVGGLDLLFHFFRKGFGHFLLVIAIGDQPSRFEDLIRLLFRNPRDEAMAG